MVSVKNLPGAFLLVMLFSFAAFSQGVKGKIVDSDGDPVSYANVYVSDLSKGTTSNVEGNYELKLPAGTYEVTYQYLGYETQSHKIEVTENFKQIDIELDNQHYEIPEVVVYSDSEDPAYHIMRKAIAMSQYYKNQVAEYSCRVYLKGTGIIDKIPGLIKGRLKKEGIQEGETFITENISNIHFELPNEVNQEVISVRSNRYSENIDPMGYITMNFYHENESPISPLDRRAFNVYEFELENSYKDKGRLINKIKVIPKREGYDLFAGYIHIAEYYWNIHSVDLTLEQKMFQMNIRQMYSPVEEDIWMPVSHHLEVEFSAMGFEGKFNYAGSVNYKTVKRNEALDHSFLAKVKENLLQFEKEKQKVFVKDSKKEDTKVSGREKRLEKLSKKEKLSNSEARRLNRMMRKEANSVKKKQPLRVEDKFEIVDSAKNRSVAYWDSIRPIPLTETEKTGYEEKDSIDLLMEDPEYRDSVKKARKKFRLNHLITGKEYTYTEEQSKLDVQGLVGLRNITFNTVDGWKYKYHWAFDDEDTTGRWWKLDHNMSYAFARKQFMSEFRLQYRYNPMKRSYFYFSGGRKSADFNRSNAIFGGLNMLTSLFLKENHVKYYQKDFVRLGHAFDISNGLRFSANIELAERTRLFNNTKFNIWDPLDNKMYTSNTPDNVHVNAGNIENNRAAIVHGKLSYTPRYYYRIDDGIKRMLYSHYPTFSLSYAGGISGVLGADSRFHYLELAIDDELPVKGFGRFKYYASAGKFFNADDLYFADFKHFSSNTPFLASNLSYKDFRMADYYEYSTNDAYVEGHVQYINDRILLKRLPILNQTLMTENIYVNFLKTANKKNYYELGYGLNQVFLFFNLEIFAGFQGSEHVMTGFKVSFPLIEGSQTISAGE